MNRKMSARLGYLGCDWFPDVGDSGFLDETLHERVRIKPEMLVSRDHVGPMFQLPQWECCGDLEHSIVQFVTVLPWSQQFVDHPYHGPAPKNSCNICSGATR